MNCKSSKNEISQQNVVSQRDVQYNFKHQIRKKLSKLPEICQQNASSETNEYFWAALHYPGVALRANNFTLDSNAKLLAREVTRGWCNVFVFVEHTNAK